MFAILSGLNTGTVCRLHNTWERLPSKYQKLFDDLLHFLDPTRNMSKYRNLLNNASSTPPVVSVYQTCIACVPWIPVVLHWTSVNYTLCILGLLPVYGLGLYCVYD